MCIAAAMMAACESDDTDFSDIIDSNAEAINPDDYLPSFDFDTSSLAEAEETILAGDNDYHENWSRELTIGITFGEGAATISGDCGDATVKTDGAHVTVRLKKDNICLALSGQSSDGWLKIYGDSRFMIEMDGLSLHNPEGAAINSQCKKTMYLVLKDGTENTLSDGETYAATGTEDMKGCLFSEGQIVMSGNGSLNITAQGKNGMASDDYIVTRPGIKLYIEASAGNGMKANDGIFIRGGAINIASSGAGYKGINSELGLTITGGRTIIHSSGATRIENADTISAAALKCDSTLTMKGGTLYAKATGEGGKGINSNLGARLLGGTVAIATYGDKQASSPRAIKADGDIEISSASVVAYSMNTSPIKAGGSFSYNGGYTVLKENDNFFLVEY